MSEALTTTNESRLSVAVAKTKMQLALTKTEASIQALHDAESKLVYNEDSLQSIADFINKVKKAENAVEDKRKELKESALQECRNIDEGAKLVSSDLKAIRSKVSDNYTKLCLEMERRKQEAEKEKLRVQTIREGITNNILSFSTEIANCTTNEQLLNVERRINLEKGRSEKYQEFLSEFRAKAEPLTAKLTEQKKKIKALEETNKQLEASKATEDDAKTLELMGQKEVLEAKIAENSQNVVNDAINQGMETIEVAEEIIPAAPKPKRSVWKFEAIQTGEKEPNENLKLTEKKMPSFIKKSLDEDAVKIYLDAKKAEGIEGEEFTVAGIRFYLNKTF